MATTIQSQCMVSWVLCTYMVLTLMCGLAIRTSTASTCTIYGQVNRTRWENVVKKINETDCRPLNMCEKYTNVQLSCSGGNTCTINNFTGKGELSLQLHNISSRQDYMKIHLLDCDGTGCGRIGMLRFGQHIGDRNFTTVFPQFQKYNIIQYCVCFKCNTCTAANGCFGFYCNCVFRSKSIVTTVRPVLSSTALPPVSKTNVITTLMTTSTETQTTVNPTSTTGNSPTTHVPDTTQSTTSTDYVTSPKTDYVSAARQSDEDSLPIMAVVGGVTALVVIVSGLTVFVCLWRRRNKKPSDCSGPGIINPSYGDLQDKERADCNDKAGNDVHTYDMADDPKRETTYGQDYSYANFGGQPKFRDVMPSLKKDRLVKEPKTSCKADAGNAYFLIEGGVSSQNDDYDLAKGTTGHHSIPAEQKDVDISANYFVLETKDNDANERVETLQTEGNNYFLLEERANSPPDGRALAKGTSAITETGNGKMTGIQGDNYFLVEQQNNSETNDPENGVYALAQSQSQGKNGSERNTNDEQKRPRKSDRDMDPYDHVRVGHAQTNGIDDGVYDELRKQNVRYESEEIDNDYDHC